MDGSWRDVIFVEICILLLATGVYSFTIDNFQMTAPGYDNQYDLSVSHDLQDTVNCLLDPDSGEVEIVMVDESKTVERFLAVSQNLSAPTVTCFDPSTSIAVEDHEPIYVGDAIDWFIVQDAADSHYLQVDGPVVDDVVLTTFMPTGGGVDLTLTFLHSGEQFIKTDVSENTNTFELSPDLFPESGLYAIKVGASNPISAHSVNIVIHVVQEIDLNMTSINQYNTNPPYIMAGSPMNITSVLTKGDSVFFLFVIKNGLNKIINMIGGTCGVKTQEYVFSHNIEVTDQVYFEWQLSNGVSNSNGSFDFIAYYAVNGFNISVSDTVALYSTELVFTIAVKPSALLAMGNVHCTLQYDKSSSEKEQVTFDLTADSFNLLPNTSVDYSHYYTAGWYTARVMCYNELAEVIDNPSITNLDTDLDIIIENPVKNIVLKHNSTNIYQHPWSKPIRFVVKLVNDTVLPIYNVSCVIQYGDTGVEPVIKGDLTPFKNLNYSQRLPGADAEITVYVHCSNLLTSKTMEITIYVYFDCWKTQAFFNDVYKNKSTSMLAYTNEDVLLKADIWLTFNCDPPIQTWWEFYKVEDNGTETQLFEHIPIIPSIVYTIKESTLRDGMYRIYLTCSYPQFKRTPKLKDKLYIEYLLPNIIPVITDGKVETNVIQIKIDQVLVIDSSNTTDPAGKLSHIQEIPVTRNWDCVTGELLEDFQLLGYFMSGQMPVTADQDCSSLLSSNDAVSHTMPAENLILNQWYLFTLTVTRGERSSQKSLAVVTRPLDPLPVSIKCIQNCYPGSSNVDKLIVDDLHLNVELDTDADVSAAVYTWKLEKYENGEFIEETSDIPNRSTGFHVTKEWFKNHFDKDVTTKFQISCTVELSGFQRSTAFRQYVMNLPPYGGNCVVTRNDTAIAGVTMICFNCSNWKDEGINEKRDPANDKGGALKYVSIQRFLDSDGNILRNIPGIARTPTSNLNQCFQLARLPNADTNVTRLEVHILDSLTEPSAVVEFDIAATNPLPGVVSVSEGLVMIDNLLKANEKSLLQVSSLNDFQGTVDLASSIASVLSVKVDLPPRTVELQIDADVGGLNDVGENGSSPVLVSEAMKEIGEPILDGTVREFQKTNKLLVTTIKSVMAKYDQNEFRDVNSNRQLASAVIQISNGPEENVDDDTKDELLGIVENIVQSMETSDRDDPTARKLEEDATFMIQNVAALVVPDMINFMQTGDSLKEMRKLANNYQQFAPVETLEGKEMADMTEDERVFFNHVNQKEISYEVKSKVPTARLLNEAKRKYENDLLDNTALSDGAIVTIGGNDTSSMSVTIASDYAKNLATKQVQMNRLTVKAPGLAKNKGKVKILASDLLPILNIEPTGRSAQMTSAQQRLIIRSAEEVTGTVTLEREIPAVEYVTFEPNIDPEDASQFSYYTMYVRSADDDINIRILPESESVLMFKVYIAFNRDVTIIDHDDTTDCKGPTWMVTFTSKLMKENNFVKGNINYAIKTVLKEETTAENVNKRRRREINNVSANRNTTSFKLATTTSACTIWDKDSETWKSDVCQGTWNPDENKLVCNCPARREMTFANTFYVAPNTIDFSTVFLKFSPEDQAAVIAVLVLVFLIYVLVIIWARRHDRKDLLKWGVTPLADNFPEDSYFYVVKVFTGMRAGAGTRSRVSFVVGGNEVDTGIRGLSDGVRKDIPTGSVMNFLMATRTCLGDLEYLRIWHDNSGSGNHASWYLSKIEVHDVQLKESFVFQAERWLAIEKDDGLLECVFPVSKSENYNVFKNRFVLNAKENLAESHMWISVAYRPQASNFTRVQRASCALVFIMLSMIANAVYFQATNEENYDIPTEIIVGPFRFSLQQIYVSLVTALIVTPMTLVVIYLFKKSKKPKFSDGNKSITHFRKEDKSKRYKIPLFDDWFERERLQSLELEKHLVEKGNPKIEGITLPETFHYLGWFTVGVTVLTCGFFILLYSAEWGKQKSEEWLTTFILSFVESVFCFDPIKVAFMALTFAIIFRSTKQSQADVDRKNILRNYSSRIKKKSGGKRKPAPPLDQEKLNAAREWRLVELMMRKAMRDIALNIFHAWILFSIAYSNLDSQSYLLHEEIKDKIVEPSSQTQFSSITTIDEYFDWLNNTAISNMFPENELTGERLPWRVRQFINDESNFRVGPPRLRQMRARKQKPCSIPYIESEDCLDKYSESTEDDSSYCIGWKNGPCDDKERAFRLSSSAWKYTSAFDIWGLPITGVYTTYGGGGYIAKLSVDREVSQIIVKEMFENSWIDRQTRGIFFEFTLYCLNSNIFVYSVLLVEFPETGGALTYSMVFPLRVYQHQGPTGQYTLACEIIFLVYLLGFTVVAIINVYQQRKAYFKEPWQVYDLVFIILSYTAVIFYVIRIVMINDSLRLFLEDKKEFVNFYHVALWNLTFVVLLGILCFMATLRIMNSLGYNKRIGKTARIFKRAGRDLLSFAIFFICYYFFYAFFGYLLFGSKLEPYKNIVKTLETLFLSLLGATTLTELEESDPVMAKIYFITFIMFMVYFVMTMFMAILCEAIDEINAETYADKEGEVVDYVLDKLKGLFTFGGRAKQKPVADKDEDEEEAMKYGHLGRQMPAYFTNRSVLEYIRDSMSDALQDYRNEKDEYMDNSPLNKSDTSFDRF
ncbi:uncharacterized protein LOC123562481 [Mercenaria mercenaria]|uniref:uncharacterized protein LOC123562481 n=1 Tax=Mercenaria mercenaria TaxID=6596 RepID=UPI00234E9EB7|nr:uncharacterized protein LOC123562481 [Mercenaria mercenaria]